MLYYQNNTLDVSGNTQITGNLSVENQLIVGATASVGGSLNVGGNIITSGFLSSMPVYFFTGFTDASGTLVATGSFPYNTNLFGEEFYVYIPLPRSIAYVISSGEGYAYELLPNAASSSYEIYFTMSYTSYSDGIMYYSAAVKGTVINTGILVCFY
jgi:hypothetical protein